MLARLKQYIEKKDEQSKQNKKRPSLNARQQLSSTLLSLPNQLNAMNAVYRYMIISEKKRKTKDEKTKGESYNSKISSHSLQTPTQFLCTHRCLDVDGLVSTGGTTAVGPVGGAVIVPVLVGGSPVPSQQPQKRPGVEQVDVSVAVGLDVVVGFVGLTVVVRVGDVVELDRVDVMAGASVGSSRQPQKRPGVLHVVVVVVVVVFSDVVVVVIVVVCSRVVVWCVVVDSSRHPHQPGVAQVCVRVRVLVDVELVDVVECSVPLLSNIFQFAQSRHSGVALHTGTSS